MIFNKDHPLRVVTLCSGYDSQCLALERLKRDYPDFDYELVAWSEFDPETPNTPLERQAPVVAHNALFPQWKDRNLGDLTKIDWGGNQTSICCSILHLASPLVPPAYNTALLKVQAHVHQSSGMYVML